MAIPKIEESLDPLVREILKEGVVIFNGIDQGIYTNIFVDSNPNWVMFLLNKLHRLSRSIGNYREFRRGLIELAALCLLMAAVSDEVELQRCKSDEDKTS